MAQPAKEKAVEAKDNSAIATLRQQIKNRIEAMGSNVRALERKAGLNVGTLNNIISGASTNPTSETLTALANAFDCSIDELLGRKLKGSNSESQVPSEFQAYKWNKLLFDAISSALDKELKNRKLSLDSEKALTIFQEVYLFSLRKGRESIDESLIEWLLDKMV